MDLELALKLGGALLTLGITIRIIKITLSKKITSNAKNGVSHTQNVSIEAETGASPFTALGGRDAFTAQEMHIFQNEDNSGKRRQALRALKKANDGIIWAIDQSKNPLNGNTPGEYLKKLHEAFEFNYANFKKADLELLEPIITQISYRKKFSELEAPCTEFKKIIDTL